ncbi:MAG: hypothetical protein EHM91_05750 [Planctomycetota bacterium]|nr:MAG: hypothetical protein EHM91_05750 [Planctomycetota bacterium]
MQFQLTGQLPSIAPGEPPSFCNFGVSTADFPGSALARLLTVRVTKPNGSPLAGELVRPFVSKFNNLPPTFKVGKFMPAKAFSDQNGEARFAFVVDDNAQPGDFTMQFGLPEFRAPDGTEVHFDVAGRVRHPSTEFRGDPIIDSGQGQIGALGKDLSKPLRAKTDRQGGFIVFKVIEGNGVFTPTANSDVRDPGTTACGKPIWLLAADNNGFAELNFQRSTDVALIEISQGSDVFAVGPHEVSFASPGLAEIPNLFPVDLDQASSSTSFRVMVKVPKGETPEGDLKSINSLGEETPTIQDAVAPTVLNDAALAFQLVGATAEYDVFASREIIDTSQLQLPDETVTPGGPFAVVQTTDFGGAVAAVTVLGEERKFTIRNTKFVKATKADVRPLIFNKRSPPTAAGELVTVKVSFKLGDMEALETGQWSLGALTKQTDVPEIFLTFKEADEDGHAGTEADPIVLGVPENTFNTRRNYPISAVVTFNDALGNTSNFPLSPIVRIAQTEKFPEGATSPGEKSQAGLRAIANWGPGPGANPPKGLNDRVFTFADVATAPPFIKGMMLPGINLDTNRLSFIAALDEATAVSYRDDISFQIYGAVISGDLWDYPRELISAVIEHEAAHLRNAFDAQIGDTAFKVLSETLQGALTFRNEMDAYLVCFDHFRIELNDLLDPRFSYRFINGRNIVATTIGRAGGEVVFIQAFNGVVRALVENEKYTFVGTGLVGGVREMKGVQVGPNLLTELKNRLYNDYRRAVKAFPELKSREEFDESNQLLRPPQ